MHLVLNSSIRRRKSDVPNSLKPLSRSGSATTAATSPGRFGIVISFWASTEPPSCERERERRETACFDVGNSPPLSKINEWFVQMGVMDGPLRPFADMYRVKAFQHGESAIAPRLWGWAHSSGYTSNKNQAGGDTRWCQAFRFARSATTSTSGIGFVVQCHF